MKNLLFLVLLISGLAAHSQTYRYLSNPNETGFFKGSAMVDSFFYLPRNIPTQMLIRSGAIRYQTSDSSIYVWTGLGWVKSGSNYIAGYGIIIAGNVIKADTANLRSNVYTQWPLFPVNDSTLGIKHADSTHSGYLDSIDWRRFSFAYYHSGTGGGSPVTSVFGRTGAIVGAIGDYTAAQVTNAVDQTVSYTNPSWISTLAWSKITGAPSFITGVNYFNNGAFINSTAWPNLNFQNGTNISVSSSNNVGASRVDYQFNLTGISPNWINVCDAPYNADSTGVALSTTAFRNAIATGKSIYVPQGRFKIDTILKLNTNQVIMGNGKQSVIYTVKDTISIFETADSNTIRGIAFRGYGYLQSSVVATQQNGIKINGNGNSINDCWFENLRGSGVWIFGSTGSTPGGGNRINNITAHLCTVGVYNYSGAEYSTISAATANECYIGFWEVGGNTQFFNLQADWCQYSFRLTTGANSDHNKVVGFTFNHSSVAAIDVQSTSFTWTFLGGDIWNGAEITLGSVGVANEIIIEGCTISNTTIHTINANNCIVRYNNFRNPVTVTGTTGITFLGNTGTGASGPQPVPDNRTLTINGVTHPWSDGNLTYTVGAPPSPIPFRQISFKPGTTAYPAAGDSVFINPVYEGYYLELYVDGKLQTYGDTVQGYKVDSSAGKLIAFPPFTGTERIIIKAYQNWPTFDILTGSSFDTDAQTYFTAVAAAGGTLTTAQKNAYNAFVIASKADGTYALLKIAYPIMGGTLTSAGVNAILPGTNNLTYTGSPTADAVGISWSANTDFAETGFNVSSGLTQNSYGLGYYSQTNNSVNGTDIGVNNNTVYCVQYNYFSGSAYGFLNDGGLGTSGTVANSLGVVHSVRTSSTAVTIYKNGSSIATGSHTSSALPSATIELNHTYTVGGNRKCGFAWVDGGMNSTQAGNFYSDLNTFLTAVSK